jgi:hypothetical protein
VIVSDAQEAAEAENRVRHPAADLVDHHALDRADLLSVGAIDGGAFDLSLPISVPVSRLSVSIVILLLETLMPDN